MSSVFIATFDSPIGPLTVAARDSLVCLVQFGRQDGDLRNALQRWYPEVPVKEASDPGGARRVLNRYFQGELESLDELSVELHGTNFQKRVWQALRSVRAGTTASYTDLAKNVGAPAAVRAVGAANGANPIAVVLPCHRIIGSNGSLVGYGGGLQRKRWLLAHEGVKRTLF